MNKIVIICVIIIIGIIAGAGISLNYITPETPIEVEMEDKIEKQHFSISLKESAQVLTP